MIKKSIKNISKLNNVVVYSLLKKILSLSKDYMISPRHQINNNSYKNFIKFNSEDFFKPGSISSKINRDIFKFDLNLNSVSGYVPFIQGKTKIIIYNFFSTNYGVRKNFAVNIYGISKSETINLGSLTLGSQKTIVIDTNLFFDNHDLNKINLNSIVIEAFSPFIKKNHGGHDGHLRFWGLYSETGSIVHSMPVQKGFITKKKSFSDRRVFPMMKHNSFIDLKSLFSQKSLDMNYDKNTKILDYYGYNIIKNDKNINAVWHDSMLAVKNFISIPQIIPILPIQNLNCHIFLSEYITTNEEEMLFELYNDKEEKIKSASGKFQKNDEIKLLDLFPEIDSSYYYNLIVKKKNLCEKNKPGYLHTFYSIDNKILDCVHSLHLRKSDNKDIEKNNIGKQALKFIYYNVSNKVETYIVIIGTNYPHHIKFRIMNFEGEEIVVNLKIESKFSHFFSVKNILSKITDMSNNFKFEKGIIQLETSEYNLDATGFIFDQEKNNLAIDHLTGG